MLYITWSKHDKQMKVDCHYGIYYVDVSCVVRNELNGRRPNPKKDPWKEVVYGITADNRETSVPVMPRPFPVGLWNITWVQPRFDDYQKPYLIMTGAHQGLDVWELDKDGRYVKKTGDTFDDWMYGIHMKHSNTSLGCITVESKHYFNMLRLAIEEELVLEQKPKIEVVA